MRVRLAAAVIALMVAAGCGLAGGSDEDVAAPAPVAATPSDVPTSTELLEEPTEEPVEEPSPTPSKKKATKKPKPSPTGPTNNFQAPACADYEGKEVSKAKAKAALNTAAGRTYWPQKAPELKVPADLVRAVAWHESGWTSNIVNCDGGFGLMQVMPDTEDFINTRFEKAYNSRDYKQNATLGANYLAWLTKWFGEHHFKEKYDLSTSKCKSDSSLCLLNMVIAGYNMGHVAVDEAYANGELANPEYVANIRANMRSCFCDQY
ncbi:lytic transglycosylase domain-containing protein [Actinoplanes sp. NBC_00393]|uniref:lytic transglycosylase domain-containing protein n=1 Tax=Actinoplanes sp. NBC_00393 TaxID=2975953 RepID=UPI002E20C53A